MDPATPTPPPDLRTATTADLLEWRDRVVATAAAHIAAGRLAEGVACLRQLELATVDERTLELTDPLLPRIASGRRVVATSDPTRAPGPDEVVIVYGNYPHMYGNVVVNNPLRRHVADFWRFHHHVVEYDHRWNGVDRIFIINSDSRPDRLDDVLRELAAARAPFDRITRIPAVVVDGERFGAAAGQIGCIRSHLVALREARDAGHHNILVLEDDFCFTSDLAQHLRDLSVFLERQYDYLICLVATSKYGPVVPHDDLIARSYQVCTNTGGYLASESGIQQLIPIYEDAQGRMESTGVMVPWAPDRCWATLQASDRFFVFRRKFGFQTSSYSDIEGSISRYLD